MGRLMTSLMAICGLFGSWVLLGLGNTVGYHRLLTHRAFTARAPVRWVLTLLGAVHSGSPIVWVGIHRHHHLRSDQPEDPHTPMRGFWAGHTGWLIGSNHPLPCILFALSGFGQQLLILRHDVRFLAGRNPPIWRALCPDLVQERFMRWLDTPLVMPALFGLQVWAVWSVGGIWGIAWLWSVHVFLTNTSWAVNSVCHWPKFGVQPYDTKDRSRDVAWMAWLANGEGFHNSHHRYPKSACHGLQGGPDFSWVVIRALVALGLASDPWLPRSYRSRLDSPDA
jgi:stearoyl-CoA desaturase (delta-9 desaturase)